jgi:hypothetical protein
MPIGVKYGKWEEDDMSRALDSVRNGDVGVNEAARTYDVPRATLQMFQCIFCGLCWFLNSILYLRIVLKIVLNILLTCIKVILYYKNKIAAGPFIETTRPNESHRFPSLSQ